MRRRRLIVLSVLAALVITPLSVWASDRFDDVGDDNIFHDDISWLAESGVTIGCNPPENTNFCPGENVTREQMAAFLRRLGENRVVDAGWLQGYSAEGLLDAVATNVGGPVAAQLAEVNLANAKYQDVEEAEADGYERFLACFEHPAEGGMGQHYVNQALLDGNVEANRPEAMVYELDADGEIVGLVAHEYIVPVDAWTEDEPPSLFGQEFTQHGVLPVWKLHIWIWKDNPNGAFADHNPKVRLCPEGEPVFPEPPASLGGPSHERDAERAGGWDGPFHRREAKAINQWR
ncbi:MAG: hypothetical protein GEU79_12990 [Acidimicrobiia bacterium]|nr:hypothetical protein [Acidimicrobiia bacterium]